MAETVWVWDSNLLSPIEAALYENGVMEGRRYRVKTWEEKIQWKSKNDVLLPIRIFFDFPYSIRRGDELVTLSDTRLTQFHWISINEDIPAEDFAISLDDFAAIESQIDPEKVGANFQ